jgi:hypothetical protein
MCTCTQPRSRSATKALVRFTPVSDIVGDVGLELGIQTGEGANVQRSGIGIYLRSDHMAKRKPALSLFAMANPDYEVATAG